MNIVADDSACIVRSVETRRSLSAIAASLLDSDLVDDARSLSLIEANAQIGAVVVPSALGWAMVDALGRRAYTEELGSLLPANIETGERPEHWRLVWALPQDAHGETTDAAARTLFDLRRPYARLLHREGDCFTFAVDIDSASPYFEGHFERAAVLAGVVQVEWAVRFGRELFGIGDDFRCMEALKFQKVIRPGDAVKMVLDWDSDRATLTFGFSSQVGRHSSGRIVFGVAA